MLLGLSGLRISFGSGSSVTKCSATWFQLLYERGFDTKGVALGEWMSGNLTPGSRGFSGDSAPLMDRGSDPFLHLTPPCAAPKVHFCGFHRPLHKFLA